MENLKVERDGRNFAVHALAKKVVESYRLENLKKDDRAKLSDLINLSVNETLPRTLKTSITTLLALTAIYLFGGEILRGFSFALIWGVIVGTYSSIFIASPLILIFNVKRDWSEVIDNTP